MGFEPTCPCGQLHFECSSLQPLRYASVYKYSLLGTNHMISSAAPSTTRTTLRVYFRPVFFPEICSKIRWRENRRDGKKYSILRFSLLRNIKENQGDEIPSFCRNFESFPPCDFWWKLSEDGSTQRKPKSCGILRILASVFRFYLNPQGFPSSSHFCPEL